MNTDEVNMKKLLTKRIQKIYLINYNPNYSLNIYNIIQQIYTSKDFKSQTKDNEYFLNILFMSSKLNDWNKLSCLLLLYYFYRKDKNKMHLLDYLFFKICKLCIKQEILDFEIVKKILNFPEVKNFLYGQDYHLRLIKNSHRTKNR